MPEFVNVHEVKTRFSRSLDKAHAGKETALSKAGKHCVKLVQLEKPERKLSFVTGHLNASFFEPLPDGELDGWRG